MSALTAQDVLDEVNQHGVQVSLTECFDLNVFPASKLQPSHRLMLRMEKPKLVEHLARQAAKDLIPACIRGNASFIAYHDHHFNCPLCVAAGKGYGKRCNVGQPLWFKYHLESYCDE